LKANKKLHQKQFWGWRFLRDRCNWKHENYFARKSQSVK